MLPCLVSSFAFLVCLADGFVDDIALGPPPPSPVAYIDSLAILLVVSVLMGLCTPVCGQPKTNESTSRPNLLQCLLIVFLGFCLCCARYCCVCGKCRFGRCCGNRYPTPKNRKSVIKKVCSCGLGLERNERTGHWFYPKKQRMVAFALAAFFLLLVYVWVGHGMEQGINALGPAVETIAGEAGVGAMQVAKKLFGSVAVAGLKFVSETSVGLVFALRDVVNQAANVSQVVEAVECTLGAVDSLALELNFTQLAAEMDGAVTDITIYLQTDTRAAVSTVNASVQAAKNSTEFVVAVVNAFSAQMAATGTTIDAASAALGQVEAKVTELKRASDGTAALAADFALLSTLPTQTERDDATTASSGSLSQVVASSPGGSDRSALLSRLAAIDAKYAAMPDYGVTADNMDLFNTRINGLMQGGGEVDVLQVERLADLPHSFVQRIDSNPSLARFPSDYACASRHRSKRRLELFVGLTSLCDDKHERQA